MIGGYSQIQGGLDIYHWQCVISMAWFSTVTHLLTLTILREEAKPNKTLRIIRITAMAALILMIVYGMVPIGYTMTLTGIWPSTPTWCFFHPGVTEDVAVQESGVWQSLSYNWEYMLFSGGILILGFLTRVLLLFSTGILHLLGAVFQIPGKETWRSIEGQLVRLKELIATSSNGNRLRRGIVWMEYKLLRSFYALLIVGLYLYDSKLWEVQAHSIYLANIRNLNWKADFD
jgi:hypothetical protein